MSMSARELLLDAVLQQIVTDVEAGDLTAIHELLFSVPTKDLEGFLSEVNDEQNG
jgi:hypothetical protein